MGAMITCGPGHRPPRSCLLAVAIVCLVLAMLLMVLWLGIGIAGAVEPQPCPGKFNAAVQPGFSLNIRTEAGGTSKVTGTLTEKDGVKRIVESVTIEGRNFFRLEEGGWIIGRYLSIVCDPEATPTPTVAVTSTPTTTPQPTPTRIMHNSIWCSSEPEVRRVGEYWIVECER